MLKCEEKMPIGEIPASQADAIYLPPSQNIQWWNILLLVIGVIIVFLLGLLLRVGWKILKKEKEEKKEEIEAEPRLTDEEFGKALAAKKLGESYVNNF